MSKQVGRVFLTLGFLVVVACGVSGGPSLLSSNSPQPTPSQVGSLPDLQYVDASGVLYIADSSNNAIRKVANGTITTIAGIGGVSGSTGDGGLATAAKLSFPVSVVVDKAGANLYIADYSNYVIRKVNLSTGIITTVAGTIGVSGATGDGGAATSAELSSPTAITIDGTGNLYIADSSNCAIRKGDQWNHYDCRGNAGKLWFDWR
jgi:sugar lactone lactonase YvrE